MLRWAAVVIRGLRTYPAAMRNGDVLYVDLREDMCHGYFYFGGLPHEPGTEVLMRNVLRAGDTFVDVGANIGYFTRLASHLVGPGGSVHAFEPMPAALRLLRLNTADLRNVNVYPFAVGQAAKKSLLSVNSRGDRSSLFEDPNARKSVPVDVVALDDVLDIECSVEFIKLDCEGWELEALRGASQVLDRSHPVLYFEFLESYASRGGFQLSDFEELLAQHGYIAAWVNQVDPHQRLFVGHQSTYVAAIPISARAAAWALDTIQSTGVRLW